jgi:hypothetical protein
MAGDLHVSVIHLGLSQAVNGSEEHGKVLRAAAGHDGVDGDLFDRRQAKAGLHHHEHVLGLVPRPLEHLLDRSRSRRYDRQAIAPIPLCQEAIHRGQPFRRRIHFHRKDLGGLAIALGTCSRSRNSG